MESRTLEQLVEILIQCDHPIQKVIVCEDLVKYFRDLASKYFLDDDDIKASILKTVAFTIGTVADKYRAEFIATGDKRAAAWAQIEILQNQLKQCS